MHAVQEERNHLQRFFFVVLDYKVDNVLGVELRVLLLLMKENR